MGAGASVATIRPKDLRKLGEKFGLDEMSVLRLQKRFLQLDKEVGRLVFTQNNREYLTPISQYVLNVK